MAHVREEDLENNLFNGEVIKNYSVAGEFIQTLRIGMADEVIVSNYSLKRDSDGFRTELESTESIMPLDTKYSGLRRYISYKENKLEKTTI